MKTSSIERTFLFQWKALGGPPLQSEYPVCKGRRWRFDFAHPVAAVAIEIEGGQWTRGRHTRGLGFEGDCEKYNRAALDGWRVFRFTGGMLRHPLRHLLPVIQWLNHQIPAHHHHE